MKGPALSDVEAIKTIVRSRFSEIHSIADVARLAGCSAETIRKDFVRKEHLRLSSFIARVKVEAAKRMLERTMIACRDVCLGVGFSREEVGERIFKRHAGITMKRYGGLVAKNTRRERHTRIYAAKVNR